MKTRNKERETSSAAQLSADPRMIFIRNLPYNLTDPEVLMSERLWMNARHVIVSLYIILNLPLHTFMDMYLY